MRSNFLQRQSGRNALVVGALALGVYLVMLTVTIPRLMAISGARPFDLRPGGYNAAEAATLLQALGQEGRGYYLWRQIPLDIFYPALLALTLVFTVQWATQGGFASRVAAVTIGFASVGAVADYAKNAGIVLMLTQWPDLSPHLVAISSLSSVLKAVATTGAALLTIGLVLWRLVNWRRTSP